MDELEGLAFACIEACGFCCTFQAELTMREAARIRARIAPKVLRLTSDGERHHLGLQGGCGACTLLSRRACTVYEDRPQHCRYFPFHLHFAEEPEVYVNRTCRGVETRAGGDLTAAFREQVMGAAKPADVKKHEEQARATYAEFTRRARRTGTWADPEGALADARREGARLFTREGFEKATDHDHADALVEARKPFAWDDVVRRPYHLAADLRWFTFHDGPDGMAMLEMDETGALTPHRTLPPLPEDPPSPAVREGLAAYFDRLTRRGSFRGAAYAVVDDEDYAIDVPEGIRARVADVVSDLLVRERILRAWGVPGSQMAHEVERFYDSTFLDAPTIGGWL